MNKSRFASSNRENVLPDQWHVVKGDVNGPRKRAKKDSPREALATSQNLPGNMRADRENAALPFGSGTAPTGGLGAGSCFEERALAEIDLNKGATDFSSLGSLLRKPINQSAYHARPSTRHLEDRGHLLPPPPANVQTLRNAVHHDDMLGSLLGTSFAALSRDCPPAAVLKRKAPGPDTGHPVAQSLDNALEPPFDWSLKTALRVSASGRLLCCEPGAPSMSGVEILQTAGGHQEPETDARGKVQAALVTWRYPDTPMQPALAATLGSAKGGEVFMRSRRESWQEALRNLFVAQRAGACDAFYCMAPDGCKKPFVAFFGAAGVGGRGVQHAWLSHSSHGLRMLLEQEHGLKFRFPLAETASGTGCDLQTKGLIEAELAELGQARAIKPLVIDGTPKSLLLFEGSVQVSGFFDYLYNTLVQPSGAMTDVPLLLAPVPFLNASLQQLSMQVKAAGVAAGQDSGNQTMFRAEIHGIIPPWGVDRLARVLRESVGCSFEVMMDTCPWTAAFNLDSKNGRKMLPNATHGGPKTLFEAARWRTPSGDLAGAVVRTLTCDGERFSARLARL